MNPLDIANNHIVSAFERQQAGDYIQAVLHFDAAVDAVPELFDEVNGPRFYCAWNGFKQAQDFCMWRHYDRLQRLVATGVTQGVWVIGEMTLAAPMLSNLDLLTFTTAHSKLVLSEHVPIEPFAFKTPKPTDKIKIGFVGSDFFNQATAYLLTQAISQIDRSQFEVFAYDFGAPIEDDLRSRSVQAYDHLIGIHDLSDADAARRIHSDGIEVLFSIKTPAQTRLGIFVHRPSPIQVHYLYFPGTSGMPFFDAFIADDVVVPPELEYGYAEKIWRIDGCYQPNDDTRELPIDIPRSEWGLPEQAIVLANMSQNYKITPTIFDCWMRILKANPQCLLWLLYDKDEFVAQRLQNEAAMRGVDPNRIYFSPKMGSQGHFSRLRAADIILDTTPYGGHTLTSDALWAGTPVVTIAGQTYASRVAASLLTDVGMPELITSCTDEYTRTVQALIDDAPRRTAYREHLTQNRFKFDLFSSSSYARRFEKMIRHYARGA